MSNQTEEQEQIIICKQLIESKDYDSALRIIEEFLLKYPEDEELLNDKGIILTKLGKYKKLLNILRKHCI